jgi:hypothetical protein
VFIRCFLSLALVLGIATPAFAAPTIISHLGTAPLLGSSSSVQQLRQRVSRNEDALSAAGQKVGLTAAQYAQFRAAIDSSRAGWVTVPRHLDAMSWRAGSRVYAIHDVIIPAGTHGWEVDLPDGKQTLAIYMPALCGNLSILRKQAPAVAQRPPTRVLAETYSAPAPAAPDVAAVPAPVVAAPPPVVAAAPAAPVVAEAAFPPVAAAAHHGISLLPLLFGAAAFLGGSSSRGTGGPIAVPPTGACP